MNPKLGDTEFFTAEVVAKKLGVGARTLRTYIRDGFLRAQKVGGRWLITSEAIADFLNARHGGPAGTRGKAKPKTKKRRK